MGYPSKPWHHHPQHDVHRLPQEIHLQGTKHSARIHGGLGGDSGHNAQSLGEARTCRAGGDSVLRVGSPCGGVSWQTLGTITQNDVHQLLQDAGNTRARYHKPTVDPCRAWRGQWAQCPEPGRGCGGGRGSVPRVGVHVFGLCATALVTDVIQLATGYHAPFFLTVCKPNYTLLGTPCDANPYITQDICSGTDKHAILSARKTFPSQHATLSAFAAVYVSMYFNSIISDSTKLLKPILVFAFAIAAGICGLTQITQYRSHPADVYVGFLIGAGIAAYLAFHAVGNFRAPTERVPAQAPAKDALRALTQRGHDSVYHQNKSVSTDELNPQARLEEAARPVPREKNSLGSLKRASVDVDLLAPRSPMGKENMVTFSNTLPRVNTPSMDDPARRHMTIHVPVDASRSKQLITEWKQNNNRKQKYRAVSWQRNSGSGEEKKFRDGEKRKK
uniref:Phospholipid phosphatase-related protein type 3 n=1 Tax=Junco hyemalis TaxID=40217 RepID=A0A8C5IRE5_JUNHY